MMRSALDRMMWHAVIAVALAVALLFARIALAHQEVSALPVPASNAGNVAGAVQPPGAGGADSITLARALAHEAWGSAADYAPILHVLRKRAERAGVPLATMARRYVSAYRIPERATAWKAALTLDCEEPPHWPSTLSWSRQRQHCERIAADVLAFLAGELADPCPRAMHWGGRTDAHRMTSNARIACGATANTFWADREVISAREAGSRHPGPLNMRGGRE